MKGVGGGKRGRYDHISFYAYVKSISILIINPETKNIHGKMNLHLYIYAFVYML